MSVLTHPDCAALAEPSLRLWRKEGEDIISEGVNLQGGSGGNV